MSADAGEIVDCNAVFRLSISCSVPEIFAIEVQSRPKSSRKKHVFRPPNYFGGGPPNFGPSFYNAPISDHVAKFLSFFFYSVRDLRWPRDRGDLALNKKRKKETPAKHKGRGCVIATGGPNYHETEISTGVLG